MRHQISEFLRKNQKTLLIGAAVVVLGAGVYQLWQNSGSRVPPEFTDARDRASELALEITALTNTSSRNLQEISSQDAAGNYKKALDLVQLEASRNQEIRVKANELAEQLKIMADSLEKVRPIKAAEVGKEAVATDVEIVKRLLDYNTFNNDLLVLLQERLQKNGSSETRKAIEATIYRMNIEASKINDLNNYYHELMGEFDRLTQ